MTKVKDTFMNRFNVIKLKFKWFHYSSIEISLNRLFNGVLCQHLDVNVSSVSGHIKSIGS